MDLRFWKKKAVPDAAMDSSTVFDPSILKRFEKEVATWPRDQAAAGLRAVGAVLAGRGAEFKEHVGDLTVSQFRAVCDVLDKIHGRPQAPDEE